MKRALRWPILGVLAAIAVTTAMDAAGLSNFSALPLFPLMGLFWYLERLSRRASLERAGESPRRVLVWSSLAFSLWHLSAVTLETGFDLPPSQIPVYLINVVFIGVALGLMRWMSGSMIVTSLSHGVWNGIAYSFFGFGTRVGALGIQNTALYGPEVGLLGLALNVLFVAALLKFGKILAFSLVSRDRGA